jgi:exonuclease III
MYKINDIDNHYICYGKSGMESALSKGFLKGRPYSGTALLIRASLEKAVTNVEIFDRLVSLEICDVLFISLYMPCEDGTIEALNTLHEVLANACSIIEQSTAKYIVFGGDLNVNLSQKSLHAVAINDFLLTYKVSVANDRSIIAPGSTVPPGVSLDIKYTFSNEKLQRYSLIDFICISKSLLQNVSEYKTVDSASNFSDHLGVAVTFNLPNCAELNNFKLTGSRIQKTDEMIKHRLPNQLRWDLCDTNLYYNKSKEALSEIFDDVGNYYNNCLMQSGVKSTSFDTNAKSNFINSAYRRTVSALLDTAQTCVPRMRPDRFKYWWSSSLTLLKKQAMASHNMWIAAGKPRNGPIYKARNSDKLNYKKEI